MQRDRRTNPYPYTWEIPLGICFAVLLILVLGAHAGRAAANTVAGAGPTWPPTTRLFSSVPGLLAGDASAGLADPPLAVATTGALWAWIVAAEIAVLILVAAAGGYGWTRWGPGALKGMADATEARQLLGLARLRQHRAVIRPDLYRRRKVTR